MKLRWIAAVAALFMTGAVAQAQSGIFIAPTFARISNPADTGTFAYLGEGTTSRIFGGVGMGGYAQLRRSGNLSAGLDFRMSFLRGNNAPLNSVLFGARVMKDTKESRWHPYAELLGGLGNSSAPHNPHHVNSFEWQALAGADYTLGRHLDFRVAEVGFGTVTTMNSTVLAGTNTFPQSKVLMFSSGLVFRIR